MFNLVNLHIANVIIDVNIIILLYYNLFNALFTFFCIYTSNVAAILDLRHQDGGKSLKYVPIHIPRPKNTHKSRHHYSNVLRI